MKKENKITFILNLVASVCFFISAILIFITENSMKIMYLCLGICFFCLSLVYYKKYKDENKSKNDI